MNETLASIHTLTIQPVCTHLLTVQEVLSSLRELNDFKYTHICSEQMASRVNYEEVPSHKMKEVELYTGSIPSIL